jgi:hypothetical protein
MNEVRQEIAAARITAMMNDEVSRDEIEGQGVAA